MVAATAGCRFDLPETVVDARSDPGVDSGPKICYGFQGGLVRPCFPSAPTQDLTLPATINTTNDPLCSTVVTDVPAGHCVIARANITVSGNVAVTGTRPLVLVAPGAITITGVDALDASSHHAVTDPYATTQIGAGADPGGGCSVPSVPGASGGAAGGTFALTGGAGGGGAGGSAGGTPAIPDGRQRSVHEQ